MAYLPCWNFLARYSGLPSDALFSLSIIATACFWLLTGGPDLEPECNLPAPHLCITSVYGITADTPVPDPPHPAAASVPVPHEPAAQLPLRAWRDDERAELSYASVYAGIRLDAYG